MPPPGARRGPRSSTLLRGRQRFVRILPPRARTLRAIVGRVDVAEPALRSRDEQLAIEPLGHLAVSPEVVNLLQLGGAQLADERPRRTAGIGEEVSCGNPRRYTAVPSPRARPSISASPCVSPFSAPAGAQHARLPFRYPGESHPEESVPRRRAPIATARRRRPCRPPLRTPRRHEDRAIPGTQAGRIVSQPDRVAVAAFVECDRRFQGPA